MAAKSARVTMLFLVAFLCISGVLSAIHINTGNFANITLQTAQYYWKGAQANDRLFIYKGIRLNARVRFITLLIQKTGDDLDAAFEPLTARLAESSMSDLNGRIVFQLYLGFRDWLAQVKYLQEQGAVAILYGTKACKLFVFFFRIIVACSEFNN